MARILARCTRVLDAFFRGVELSVGMTVLATVATISYGVLARDVLRLSDVWVTEVTTYLMAYMTFVGSAALAWKSRHLHVDVAGHWLKEGPRRALTFVSTLIVTVVALVIARLAVDFWWDAWTSGERSWGMFSLPLWIPYLCLVAGTVMLVIAQLVRLASILFACEERASSVPNVSCNPADELALGSEK
ncbi:TRAP transporter small permease [Trinickia acidisoli]|uniref:TRAP transporter small permease n=1 Tax=Trinickia acidisoli TaxID=2767482 RepID=UPI001A8DA430|nr:TRAP transporter small permease subunit [Trinickia acidisoli]